MNIDDITNVTEANKWATNGPEIESIISNEGGNLNKILGDYFQKLDLLRLKFVFNIDSYKGSAISKSVTNQHALNHQEQMKRSDEVLEYSKNNRASKRF